MPRIYFAQSPLTLSYLGARIVFQALLFLIVYTMIQLP